MSIQRFHYSGKNEQEEAASHTSVNTASLEMSTSHRFVIFFECKLKEVNPTLKENV